MEADHQQRRAEVGHRPERADDGGHARLQEARWQPHHLVRHILDVGDCGLAGGEDGQPQLGQAPVSVIEQLLHRQPLARQQQRRFQRRVGAELAVTGKVGDGGVGQRRPQRVERGILFVEEPLLIGGEKRADTAQFGMGVGQAGGQLRGDLPEGQRDLCLAVDCCCEDGLP